MGVFKNKSVCGTNFLEPDSENRDTILKITRKIIAALSNNSLNKMLIYSYVIQLMDAINETFSNHSAIYTANHSVSAADSAVVYIYTNLPYIESVSMFLVK